MQANHTTTFTIRDARPSDAQALIDYMRRLADEPHNGTSFSSADEFTYTLEEERVLILDYARNHNHRWIVAVDHEDHVIGMAAMQAGRRAMSGSAVLAISVAREWRRRGIATSLMKTLIEWVRDHPTLYRLELEVMSNNTGAIRLYEQLGFEHEGTRRRAVFKHGEKLDSHIMAMLFD